jgi:D-3-phosphoglycerate dehydrogenase
MKVFVTPTSFGKPQNASARALLETRFSEIVYNETGVPLTGDDILRGLEGCSAYIAGLDYVTADVVERMPNSLKVISRYGAGVDRVDIEACRKKGIAVTNTPGANATAVCELAFCLMLCAARKIPTLHNAVEAGEWPRSEGIELAGKTLGIVGMGAIGKKLALRAKAFEMKVAAYDPYFDEAFAAEHGIARMELDDLVTAADVISLHVPMTKETRHMMGAERIGRMKPGAILINTARGGLINEEAAAEALRNGRLGGIGLDAFEQEPLKDSPLKGLPGVVFTPHTGAHTAEAVANMGMMAVQNAIAVLDHGTCAYTVK